MQTWNERKTLADYQWYQRSLELHAKDHGRRMYLPTPRWCPGVERPRDMPDRLVFYGCLIGFVVLLVLGVW